MKKRLIGGITLNVLLLGIVSAINDISSEMIMPILPMFITALGGAGIIIGLIGGIRDSISSILKVFAGFWSDKTGKRKVFVFSGYASSAFFKFLLAFSRTWQSILIFLGLERVGKGIREAPRDAMIADSMPKRRGKGFGWHRALDTTGAVIGSILVFILFWFLFFDFKTIILIAGIIAFASLIPLAFVKEIKKRKQKINFRISLKKLPKKLRFFIFVAAIFALANFSYMFFILRASESFSGRFAVGIPILLYILFSIFYTALAIPAGNLSDKIGRKKVLIFGYVLFAITTLGFAFFDSIIAFIILFALYGIVFALIEGNQRAYVADLSSKRMRATALGAFHTVIGLVALPASLIAGFLWQFITPTIIFIYASVISLIAVLVFLINK